MIDPKYVYLAVTIISVLAGLWYKIKRSDERISTVWNILFLEKGGLNVVTTAALAKAVSDIEKSIQRESDITSKILERLECLSDNVIILMVHNNLKPTKPKESGAPLNVYRQVSEDKR